MTDWLKLTECKYTPSPNYALFDYTKLVVPIDNGFYLKEIVTPEQKPTFIPINHTFSEILSIHSTLNNIVAVERRADLYFVSFYACTVEENCIRVPVGFDGSPVGSVRAVCSENMLMMCWEASGAPIQQIFFVDCEQKTIVTKGYIQAHILDVSLGPNNSLSLLTPKHVTAYKNQPPGQKPQLARLYKQTESEIAGEVDRHFWIEDELVVWGKGKNKISLMIKNKVVQEFTGFHRLHNAVPLLCGFLACDGCVIKIFKKKNINYEMICEFIDENLMESRNIVLSPQQDIFVYWTPIGESLVVSTSFSQQIQQALSRDNPLQLALTLKTTKLNHQKSYDYTIYSSTQSWFASTHSTQIQLINSHNYTKFMTIQLSGNQSSGLLNTLSSNATATIGSGHSIADLKPRHLAIHPNRPIFAVALKKCVRLYYVTFNQVKVLRELPISMCGFLGWSSSGSVLEVVVTGKGGAKLYIYKLNQFKSQLLLLETITIGKKPVCLMWDTLDTCLYCFYGQGYFKFTVESKFKNRQEISLNLPFQIAGAVLSPQDTPIIWGGNQIALIIEEKAEQVQKIKDTDIKNIFIEGEYFYFVFENGRIGRSKTLDLETCYAKAYDLQTKDKPFQIRLQQDNIFIHITQDLNVQYLEFGATHNGFTDIIGVEKKKLYTIMNKHNQYESQIKRMREDFSTVLLEYKLKAVSEQKKIEQDYSSQLKDHVEREKKVKEEKTKLQEMMEFNIEVKEKESMKQIKELEKLYERKIALTTNKLLTEKEIGFRDKLTAQNNLKQLEHRFEQEVQKIRRKFAQDLKLQLQDKNETQKQLTSIKKSYETRLYQLEEQNEILLSSLQDKNQSSILNLRKMVNNWENKYSECISQKDNIERQYQEQVRNCDLLKEKIVFLDVRRIQSERRCENLAAQISKIEKVLDERNKILQLYERRIEDLEKSNEILKFRVLEVKEQNDPYESEIAKLKENLTDLEEEYDKILKSSHDQEQKLQILKKQKTKLKQDLQLSTTKFNKISKRHEELLDKVREATKSPIQEIRRELLAIIDSYARINKSYSNNQKRADSPLGELNRIRDHLEVCLNEAVTTSQKNDEQRKIEVTKKNRQNSELIIEINTMRKKIRELQDLIKDKNLHISRLMRGDTPTVISSMKEDRVETTQAQSKDFPKTKSRETFYEQSMFKSGSHWNKRLKTEQCGRRKKSSMSMRRDRQLNSLAIHPQTQQIEEYKRIIEQKDIFIQKLIAKIQKT